MRQKWVQKAFVQKVIVDHLWCSKRCFQPMASLFVTRFAPRKIPKCLENQPKMGQTWVKSRSKKLFFFGKLSWTTQRCSNECFQPMLSLFVTRFGPWKIPKCFESGPFLVEKLAKKGSKKHFPKLILELLGCATQFFQPILSPYYTFGPRKISTCFEKGPFLVEKWAKKGSNQHFSKSDPGPFGVLKQVFSARFGPRKNAKCFENRPFLDE